MREKDRAEEAVAVLLTALGYDVTDETIRDTPKRVAKALWEMTSGRQLSAREVLGTTFPGEGYDGIVLLKDIPFYSLCEHHLLPFNGKAHVAYVPSGKRVVGLSKLARLVEMHARRLQLQERLTRGIANDLQDVLEPVGVAVIIEATHLCMCARGVEKAGAAMKTSTLVGCFRDKPEARAELFELLK